MASIGAIYLGGASRTPASPVRSAAAFSLSKPAPLSYVARHDHGAWEIEVHKEQTTIVARSMDALQPTDLLATGLEFSQRCLDQLCFERHHSLATKDAADEHWLFTTTTDQAVLRYSAVSPIRIDLDVRLAITRADGSVEHKIPDDLAAPVWVPGLRFYRLSQNSSDVFDAYRNMWLGLESLLDALSAKQPDERESDWLVRALNHVARSVELHQFVPGGKDPVMYIMGAQYEHIRLRLFHAKLSASSLPDTREVTNAYELLIRIWRAIVHGCFGVPTGASGGTTYEGFRDMMDRSIGQQQLTMSYTDDDALFDRADTEVSTRHQETVDFVQVAYLGQTRPGDVSFLGTLDRRASPSGLRVRRIGSKIGREQTLLAVSRIDHPVNLEGIDCFESSQTIRLVNRQLPRSSF